MTDGLILSLAGDLGVGIIVDTTFSDHGGGAAGEDMDGVPFVILKDAPTNEVTTLTALHELGHWATRWGPRGGDGWSTKPRAILEQEAWMWALEHYPEQLTPNGAQYVYDSLKSYMDHPRYKPKPSNRRLPPGFQLLLAMARIIDTQEDDV